MHKFYLISLLFLLLFSKSYSQIVSFEDYRYTYLDTTNIDKFTKKKNEDSVLVIIYSNLYKKKHNVEYLYLLNNIAANYIQNNQTQKARQLLFNSVKLAEEIPQHSYEHAYSFYLLVNTYRKSQDYQQISINAVNFKEAIMKLEPDSILECITFSFSSKWNFAARNIELAFQEFDISNKLAIELELIYILEDNYTNAGNILTFYEPQQATKFLDYAIYLSKSNKYKTSKNIVYLYLITGASYMARDIFDKAIENFKYSLMILKRDSVKNMRFEMILNYYLASCYKFEKEYAKAINQLDFFKKGNLYSAIGMETLGDIYFLQNKYDSALIYYEQFYNTLPKQTYAKNDAHALIILNNMAVCNYKLGNIQKARKQYRECLFYMAGDSIITDDKLLPDVTPIDNSSYHYWHTLLSEYTKFVQAEYINNKTYSFYDVIECYMNDLNALNNKIFIKSNMSAKFLFSSIAKETSMHLLDFISTENNIHDTVVSKVWDVVAFSKNNYLNSQLSKENTDLKLKTDEQNRYDSLIHKFDMLSTSTDSSRDLIVEQLNCYKDIFVLSHNKGAELLYPNIQMDVNINNSIAILAENESIIDYYSNDSDIFFFTYANHKKEFHKVAKPNYVAKIIKGFSRSIKSGDESKGEKDKIIIKELGLDKVLQSNHSLYFIPDNNMATFPIEVLKDGNGNYLVENNNISYLYSISQLIDRKDKNIFTNEISCFAPAFLKVDKTYTTNELQDKQRRITQEQHLTALPYSIVECEQIDSIFKGNHNTSLRINADATSKNFYDELSKSKIIHIASHGKSSSKSLNNTGIYLYDEMLGIDFITFDKIKTNSIKTELTVLSACKTAEGANINGEGKLSLSYGFMFAGSKNVVASLWYVSDKLTQELMMRFYENIEKGNMDYSTALQNAKIDFIKQGYSPLDWGSFIILGKR